MIRRYKILTSGRLHWFELDKIHTIYLYSAHDEYDYDYEYSRLRKVKIKQQNQQLPVDHQHYFSLVSFFLFKTTQPNQFDQRKNSVTFTSPSFVPLLILFCVVDVETCFKIPLIPIDTNENLVNECFIFETESEELLRQ